MIEYNFQNLVTFTKLIKIDMILKGFNWTVTYLKKRPQFCKIEMRTGSLCNRSLFSMGALASAIFKIRLFSIRNFLTYYYCQVGVSTRVEKFY